MLPNPNEKIDPRVKRTRQLIAQSFSTLIREKGFHNLSVQDIAERAEINRATFYAHFPDKFSLLDHFIQQEFRQEIDKRMLNACRFSMDNLRILVIAVCEFVDRAHERCTPSEQQFQSLVENQVRTQIQELFNHWLEGLPELMTLSQSGGRASTAASWALYGLATEWSRSRHKLPVEQYADQVLPLLVANLGLSIEYGSLPVLV